MTSADPFAGLSSEERALLRRAPLPERAEPMLAVLTDNHADADGWVYERKLDGIRCIAIKDGGEVRMLSRNNLSLNGRFPEVAAALAADPGSEIVLDGEVVAFAGSQTSFQRLGRRGEGGARVYLYAFDLLHLGGYDVTRLPLLARKRLLGRAHRSEGPLRFSRHRMRDGTGFYREACQKGWEGVIAKRADAPYVRGRSRDWLKWKCGAEQELVIGGYTAPKGSRTDLGALLVGYFEAGAFHYAGKVGTGFTRETLRELAERLEPLRRDDPPFEQVVRGRTTTWVEPRLVAQIGFSEWTRDGRLRHPRFLGLREDKDAREVVRERPA